MPVALLTTSAMSSAVTSGTGLLRPPLTSSRSASNRAISSLRFRALSKSSLATASSFSRLRRLTSSSRALVSSGLVLERSLTRAAAWSMRSMALSGRKRSVM